MKTYFLASKNDEGNLSNSGVYHNNLSAAKKINKRYKKDAQDHGEDPGDYCIAAVEAPSVWAAEGLFELGRYTVV
jgi:hypothetical protein